MPPIKIAGKKPAAPKAAPKPAAKKTTKTAAAKTTAAKPAAAKKTGKTLAQGRKPNEKRTDGTGTPRPKRTLQAHPPERQPRDLGKDIDPGLLKKHERALEAAGKRRKKAQEEHEASVEAMHKAASEAFDAGIPMGIVSKKLDVSRQWLYKMGQYKERGNGNGAAPAPKATRKPAAPKAEEKAATAAAPKRTRSRQASEPKPTGGTKPQTGRPRIRIGK